MELKKVTEILILFILFTLPESIRSEGLALREGIESYSLNRTLQFLEDPGGRLTLADVTKSPYSEKYFYYQKKGAPSFGITRSVYWGRLHIKNNSNVDHWIFEFVYPALEGIEFYRYDEAGGQYVKKQPATASPGKYLFPHPNLNPMTYIFCPDGKFIQKNGILPSDGSCCPATRSLAMTDWPIPKE